MDGNDLARRMAPALRPRQDWEALRRAQRPPRPANGADCLKVARDPGRRFDPLRRALGRAESLPRS